MPWFEDALRDITYALRSLGRSRSFTVAAILTLAVGIGATTAIYSVVDTILLQPLPLPDADRLVRIVENDRPRTMAATDYGEYRTWRERTTTLTDLATATLNPQLILRTEAGILRLTGGIVSSNYFEVLGATALLGRTITPSDDANPDVGMLSYGAWQRYFRSDPAAVGTVVNLPSGALPGRAITIIGVLPESMETVGAPMEFYRPIIPPADGRLVRLGPLIGRLRDGVSITAASEEANAIGHAVRPPRPASAAALIKARFEAQSLKDDVVATLRPALRVFLIAVGAVLLIVCANVANLLLARGTARRREIAMRLALGASRGRVVRQVLAECVALSLTGGLLGAALAAASVSLVKRLATIEAEGVFRIVFGANVLPRAHEVAVDLRLFVIALTLAVITSVACGLLPALQLARTNSLEALGSRGASSGKRDTRLRMALVVGQMAMATMLLVGAVLLSTSFLNLANVEKGYDPSNVLAFQVVLPQEYETTRKAETIEAILTRVRSIPGVTAAGFAYAGIFVGIQDTVGSFVPPGRNVDDIAKDSERPRLKSLSPGYLEAAGVPVVAGRLLTDADVTRSVPAVVINRTVARRYFSNSNPVGQYMDWHSRGTPAQVEIVGVIEDIRQGLLQREPYAEVFMDYRQVIAIQQRGGAVTRLVDQLAFGFMSFALRSESHPGNVIAAVRQAVRGADSHAGIDAIAPFDQLVSNSLARQRFYAVMLGIFAGVAALLAAIGVYGVLAYAVIQRTQEIGIRMALGARRQQVLNLVLGRGVVLAAIGITIGLAGAIAGTRYLQTMLFGITPLDAATFALVTLAFAAVAMLASYLPARRATQVDAMVALRHD